MPRIIDSHSSTAIKLSYAWNRIVANGEYLSQLTLLQDKMEISRIAKLSSTAAILALKIGLGSAYLIDVTQPD